MFDTRLRTTLYHPLHFHLLATLCTQKMTYWDLRQMVILPEECLQCSQIRHAYYVIDLAIIGGLERMASQLCLFLTHCQRPCEALLSQFFRGEPLHCARTARYF